jgi:hypothetical protein
MKEYKCNKEDGFCCKNNYDGFCKFNVEKCEHKKLIENKNINTNEANKLVDSVLEWWEVHQYDTTGEYGDYNVYDEAPEFVKLAKQLRY